MKNYINPMVEITLISDEDVLTASLQVYNDNARATKVDRVGLGNERFWG
jgi:hypothetical protein